jgi:hypothetical protein
LGFRTFTVIKRTRKIEQNKKFAKTTKESTASTSVAKSQRMESIAICSVVMTNPSPSPICLGTIDLAMGWEAI